MSVREDDKQKNKCTRRNVGLAAAALGVGVGVGAALYYFCNKRSENPNEEGATSGCNCEGAHTLSEEEKIRIMREEELYEEEQRRIMRQMAYRGRSWSLEECSICVEIILKNQQVTTLPCTHHFHSSCITPWLEEHQTCPNCRNAAKLSSNPTAEAHGDDAGPIPA